MIVYIYYDYIYIYDFTYIYMIIYVHPIDDPLFLLPHPTVDPAFLCSTDDSAVADDVWAQLGVFHGEQQA